MHSFPTFETGNAMNNFHCASGVFESLKIILNWLQTIYYILLEYTICALKAWTRLIRSQSFNLQIIHMI